MALRRFCLLLLVALCPSLAASDNIAEPDQPLLFMTADVWPWGYLDEQGQPAGLISRLATRLAEVSGLPLSNRVLPHQRLVYEFQRQQADFTVLFENPALDDFADSQGIALHASILLVTRHDSPLALDLDALAGHSVGYIRGTYYGEAFTLDEQIVKVPVHHLDQAIDMLQIGRLDALISSDLVFHHTLLAQQLEPEGFRISVHAAGHPAHLYMSRTPSHPQHAPILRAALEQLRASGELDEMFQRPLLSGTP